MWRIPIRTSLATHSLEGEGIKGNDKSLATHSQSGGVQGNPKDDPPQKPPGNKDGHSLVTNFLEHSRRELEVLDAEEGDVSHSVSEEEGE